VPLALARGGIFPAVFARLNRAGTPYVGHIIGCALSCALIASNLSRGMAGLFEFMILLATAATLVLYLLAALSALVLRRRGEIGGRLVVATAIAGTLFALWTFYGAGSRGDALGLGAACQRCPGLSDHAAKPVAQPNRWGSFIDSRGLRFEWRTRLRIARRCRSANGARS
jgi:amino acid transporter